MDLSCQTVHSCEKKPTNRIEFYSSSVIEIRTAIISVDKIFLLNKEIERIN